MKKVAIIQARMGSSRLAGKVLKPLAGVPALQHVYTRACMIEGLDEVVIATTTAASDDVVVDCCNERNIPVYRGSEDDVLDRYVQTACALQADLVMRITADCPLLDPIESGKVLNCMLAYPESDYVTNCAPPTYPDGLDTGVSKMESLEVAWREAEAGSPYREHVTMYLAKQPERFNVRNVANDIDLSFHRWTLDEEDDYHMLSLVYDKLKRRNQFGYLHEVLAILRDYPEIAKINAHITRNEGAKKSWDEWFAKQKMK